MSELRRTTVTLGVKVAQWPLQIDVDGKVSELLSVKGVESIDIEPQPQWLRLIWKVTIAGENSKQIQRCYNKLCKLIDRPPYALVERSCNLNEMFAD